MMEATTTTQTPLAAALGYAARGWPVFPVHSIRRQGTICTCGNRACGSPGKHPRTPNGLKDASLDAAVIRGWWQRWPDAGVAVATGRGLAVIDVDIHKGGDDSLVDARRALGELPDTVEVCIKIVGAAVVAPVRNKVPSPRPDSFVRILRTGGIRLGVVADNAEIVVEAWALTVEAAHDLAQLARAHIGGACGSVVNGVAVYQVTEQAGPGVLPENDADGTDSHARGVMPGLS